MKLVTFTDGQKEKENYFEQRGTTKGLQMCKLSLKQN